MTDILNIIDANESIELVFLDFEGMHCGHKLIVVVILPLDQIA